MKEIKLTQGKVAFVDDKDFDLISKFNWYAIKIKNNYYAVRMVGRIQLKMHRFIMNVFDSKIFVDHKDRNGLNNTQNNLRVCNTSENGRNRNKQNGTTSKYKGVYFMKERKKWKVELIVNKKYIYIGTFENEIDAVIAYNKAAIEHHKEFASINVIERP